MDTKDVDHKAEALRNLELAFELLVLADLAETAGGKDQ